VVGLNTGSRGKVPGKTCEKIIIIIIIIINSIDSLQKTAVLRTSHIIRKVLQSET
jgi:hypothetical protein